MEVFLVFPRCDNKLPSWEVPLLLSTLLERAEMGLDTLDEDLSLGGFTGILI